ncbi:MAG: hypothetical protein NC543_08250 [bacterium]|nr:hypothetical protein [bacterium]MCM1373571.1 hypothetical protein [Muribaculum sp.]
MMKQEFERLAKIEVTEETYTKVIEPMYSATDLSKMDFIKLLNLKALQAPKVVEKTIKKMAVRDRSGFRKTPNGCYYHIEYVELVDVDIRTGKFIVKPLEDEDFRKLIEEGHDLNLSTDFDFDYIQCLDTKKKPVTLAA